MRYPTPLQSGGAIGFVAPSFGCATEPYKTMFDAALERFHALGHRTILGPNCYSGEGIGISSTPESCGRELTEMYLNPEADVIISCGGGELMCETISHVDFDAIREAPPKLYMGYSDNTNFTFLSATLCDTAAIYGPCAPSFGMSPWPDAMRDSWEMLRGKKRSFTGYPKWIPDQPKDEEHPLTPPTPTEPTIYRQFPEGAPIRMRGRLLGGCMDILVTLLGTRFDRVAEFNERYAKDGVIWFIESCDLNPMAMRRAMWQMAEAGWFERAAGFIIGRPLHFGEVVMGLDQYEAVLEPIRRYNVPVIMDADIGHLSPMMPIMTGAMAEVSLRNGSFKIDYSR